MAETYKHEALTHTITGSAIEVHKGLVTAFRKWCTKGRWRWKSGRGMLPFSRKWKCRFITKALT